MKTLFILALFIILGTGTTKGQEGMPVTHTFGSLEDVIAFSDKASLDLVLSNIRSSQAKKAQNAARLSIVDPTISLSGDFTHFPEQPVTLLPAEIFGGAPGTTTELTAGTPYTTEFSQAFQMQLVNPQGWSNYRLARINAEIAESNGLLTRQMLQENLADSYYAIVSLNKQLASTEELLSSADSVFTITQNKFAQGLVSQQDVNNAEVNWLNTENTLKQIEYLLLDSYLTLKTLANIPANDTVVIEHDLPVAPSLAIRPEVEVNQVSLRGERLNQDYALQNYKKSKSVLWPSLTFFAGNSYQLNNDSFQPFSGDWINSNYVGLSLNFTLPNSSSINNIKQSKLEYEAASRELEKAQHAALVEKQRLENDFDEARIALQTAQRIQRLGADTYAKNLNLYTQGLIGVDVLLDSYEAMVSAEYGANNAVIALELAQSKISINNTFNTLQ